MNWYNSKGGLSCKHNQCHTVGSEDRLAPLVEKSQSEGTTDQQSLQTALLLAIKEQDFAGVQKALDDGANVEAVMFYKEQVSEVYQTRGHDEGGLGGHNKSLHMSFDALLLAAEVGDPGIISLLLAAGKTSTTTLRFHLSLSFRTRCTV